MKKAISIAMILILVMSCIFTGCSSNDVSSGDGEDGTKWAIVYATTLGDMSFNDSAKEGLDTLKDTEENFDYNYFECANDATKYEAAFIDYADSGEYSMIWSASTSLREACEKAVAMFPEQKFALYDTEAQTPADNTYSMTYKQNDGSFLVGMVAAYVSETGVVGVIGGDDIDVINDFVVGYIQGAKQANENIKVAVSYIGGFTDVAKAKELTLAQFAQGADVCYQVASGAGLGVIEAAANEGKYAIGVDSDQAAMYAQTDPELASCIVTSMLKNVGASIVRAYEKFEEGTIPWGENEALGIAEGGVGYVIDSNYNSAVSAENQEAILEAEQMVIDGDIIVETVYGKDTEFMTELRNSVKP